MKISIVKRCFYCGHELETDYGKILCYRCIEELRD